MGELPTAAEVARTIADGLDRHGLPYAIGGALALGFYAVPRATVDVDVNIFVAVGDELSRALAALRDVGFVADEDDATMRARAAEEGQFRGNIDGLRVDVFVPSIPYYEEIAAHRRQVQLLGSPIWVLSAEDLVVLKMLFFRRKDLADVEAVLRDQASGFDRGYVKRKLEKLVGSDDPRLNALADIERDVDTEPET